MEDSVPCLHSSLGLTDLLDGPQNLVLYDEMLSQDWMEAFDYSNLSPLIEISNYASAPTLLEPSEEIQKENLDGISSFNPDITARSSFQSVELDPINSSLSSWIPSLSSITERFICALKFIKEHQREGDVLVQMWVPTGRGDRLVLTTCNQPFELSSDCERLVSYRTISMNFNFSADENSNEETVGMPGRVYLGRVPEWTPDARYFSSSEFPRVSYAQHYDVRGTLALPVFEQGSESCLGVLEIAMTSEKVNYAPDLEKICNALQAVDLRSCELRSVASSKVSNDSYKVALPEILEVVKVVCKTHKLPLAQTWILCIQHGKGGSRHSEQNYRDCVSTIDAACYVNDLSLSDFHEACSEHHLLRGQGVVGEAITTNQPCFSPNITTFRKAEYPLSHHARMFHLQAAVAIRLRSTHSGTADFVLEFFLPTDCKSADEQKRMLDSLSITLQKVSQSLRVVTAEEMEDKVMLEANDTISSDAFTENSSSQISSTMKTLQKGVNAIPDACEEMELQRQENEGFDVATLCDYHQHMDMSSGRTLSGFKQHHEDSSSDTIDHDDSSTGVSAYPEYLREGNKRPLKAEKAVSLQVLQQHFSGSLKDAAKSLGVCPTTLKRICRQHGITRWPSRKLKKVDHSLRKLQAIIESVQGAGKTFQLSSLYENLTKASVTNKRVSGNNELHKSNQRACSDASNGCQEQQGILSIHTSATNYLYSSSCSHRSTSSSCCSGGTKQRTETSRFAIKQEVSKEENQSGIHKKRSRKVERKLSINEEPGRLSKSESKKSLREHHSSGTLFPLDKATGSVFKVKATYGEEKVRFRLQRKWAFHELRQEIAKRFSISDMCSIQLKYLDDDSEWVLLTCNADLQECIDVCRSSHTDTIRISVSIIHT